MNPLLAKVKLPGRVFQLPSKGVFYKGKGVLVSSVEEGEIQVKPMSALAEMKLRSADLLMSGKILRELCEECVPEILKPEQLVSPDVDALFMFLRVVTYGSVFKFRSAHNCKTAKVEEHSIDLEASILSKPNNKLLEHAETLYKLPLSNGQIVHTRPNTYGEALKVVYIRQEINRLQANKEPVDEKLLEKAAVSDILAVIEAVEDDGEVIDDREMIEEWIRAISKPIVNEIIANVGKTAKWGYSFDATIKCPQCSAEYVHELDLDPVSFFLG
jgi:predicted Zn-ribbon and HTH transcriptional regulator